MTLAQPSINPADDGSLIGTLRLVVSKMLQSVDGMLPATVIAFNGNRNNPRVTVQPSVSVLTTANELVPRAQIASLPVFQFGAGGFLLSFPIIPGDPGWIIAADRDISLYLQTGKTSGPNTLRRKNFADALFLPDSVRNFVIAGEDADRPVFQKSDGSVKLVLADEFAKVTAPQGLGVNVDPAAHQIFAVASTTKASCPWPKMTQAQRDAIPSPSEGDAVWNLTSHGISVYNGTSWS